MGKNREPKKPVESASEPEDQEEGSEEESTEASESEPETNPVQSAEKSPKEDSSEEDEDDAESGSDSDGPGENAKPEASKPVETVLPKKLRSKLDSDPVTPSKSTAVKRPLNYGKETEAKDSKKQKTKPQAEVQTSEKKQHRLWSEEDEIVILRGLIDYAAKKKADPIADMNAFHEFIKKKIHIDATRAQVQDKVRKLKIKYTNNKSKEIDGKNRTFAKPHEQEVYELSKKIWGDESKVVANGGSLSLSSRKAANKRTVDVEAAKEVKAENDKNENVRKVGNNKIVDSEAAKEVKVENDKDGNLQRALQGKRVNVCGTVEERVMSIGAKVFEGGDDVEGAEEWRSLKVQEIEGLLNQLDVKRAQVKLVLDYLKSH